MTVLFVLVELSCYSFSIRLDSTLEEIVCKACQEANYRNMVMSTRGEAAVQYLDVMQKVNSTSLIMHA